MRDIRRHEDIIATHPREVGTAPSSGRSAAAMSSERASSPRRLAPTSPRSDTFTTPSCRSAYADASIAHTRILCNRPDV